MVDERSRIGNAINKTTQKMLDEITQAHRDFASDVIKHANNNGYRPKKMGSVTKQTQGPGSDIDIMCLIPQKNGMSVDDIKDLFLKDFKKFSPTPDKHSLKIHQGDDGIDIVPAYKQKNMTYKIPNFKSKTWRVRGHEESADKYRVLDLNIGGKWHRSVQMLKLWKNQNPQFNDLPNKAIEQICYSVLVDPQVNFKKMSGIKCVMMSMMKFHEMIQRNIKHPEGGTGLNPLTQAQRDECKKLLQKDVKKLESYVYIKWSEVFGNNFAE